MNSDQVGGIARAVIPPLIAYLSAKNIIPVGAADSIVTAIGAILAAMWSWQTNKSGTTIK